VSAIPSLTAITRTRRHLQTALQAFVPATITINNATVSVAGTLSPLRRPLADFGGGHHLVQTFTFSVMKDLLTTAPVANVTTFTLNGHTFTVREVSGEETHQAAWHIVASRTARTSDS